MEPSTPSHQQPHMKGGPHFHLSVHCIFQTVNCIHCYTHTIAVLFVRRDLILINATAVVELLMMGMRMPKKC
jgi:hypothetical protein